MSNDKGLPALLEVDSYGDVVLTSHPDLVVMRFEKGTPEETMKTVVDALNSANLPLLRWA